MTDEIKKSHTLCWSKISTIASRKWSLENDEVKQYYKDLAEKAKTLYRSKHLFYVHHGQNAAESIMFQDNYESTEKSPKTFIFVSSEYEKNPSNDSNNEVVGQQQQQNAFNESGIEVSNSSYSHNLSNEIELNFTPLTSLESQTQNMIAWFNTCNCPMTTLLHDEEMMDSLLDVFHPFSQDAL